MASKKTSGKKASRKTHLLDTDPPILVGGGGSSFVWIRKDQLPKLVEPDSVPVRAPRPQTPALYYIFEVIPWSSVTALFSNCGFGIREGVSICAPQGRRRLDGDLIYPSLPW